MKKLFICLIVLAFAGYSSADPLPDAVCVWQFGDWTDSQGPPNTDLDGGYVGSTIGVDVSADGILAPNTDNLAVQATGYTYMGGINPGELVPIGGVTMFVRHKSASFGSIDDIIQVGNGETDWDCVYGVSLESAEPRFIVYGAGQAGQEGPLMAGVTLSADTWYDITGVYDPGTIGDDSGTIDLYVYNPMNGSQLAHTSTTVPFDALETDSVVLNEIDLFVIFNAWHGLPDTGNMVELAAVWDRALSLSEVTELSGATDVIITESDGSTLVTEGGEWDIYEVELSELPTSTVTVLANPSDSEIDIGNGAGVAKNLIFTTSNWDTAQTVTVSAIDDTVYEGGPGGTQHILQISLTVLSSPAATVNMTGFPSAQLRLV